MRSPRKRSYSRSSSYERRHRRSSSRDHSYSRHRHRHRHSRDRYDDYDRSYHRRHRSPPRHGGISNPPPGHPDANPGNNIYISNLASETTENDLKELFSNLGTILDMRIIKDPFTKESRRFGFVTFENMEDAEEAIKTKDKSELQGKTIRVERARRSKPHVPTPGAYCGPEGASSKYRNSSSHRSRRSPSPLAERKSASSSRPIPDQAK
ncbi:unnamed protein product [Blepharisma stoltei]|uniref:RRM domain-containing protein n=1 Tax=Blepharisma stoltei TaxID=1481888 RepID=A0AAU9JHN3_9CILI|nr:unnamed protein product [Blepharisma stoltei]